MWVNKLNIRKSNTFIWNIVTLVLWCKFKYHVSYYFTLYITWKKWPDYAFLMVHQNMMIFFFFFCYLNQQTSWVKKKKKKKTILTDQDDSQVNNITALVHQLMSTKPGLCWSKRGLFSNRVWCCSDCLVYDCWSMCHARDKCHALWSYLAMNWRTGVVCQIPLALTAVPPCDPNTSPAAEIGLALWKLGHSQHVIVSASVWAQGIGVFLTTVVEHVHAHKWNIILLLNLRGQH